MKSPLLSERHRTMFETFDFQ